MIAARSLVRLAVLSSFVFLQACGSSDKKTTPPDTTPPTIVSTSIADSATGVARSATFVATFSEPIAAASVTSSTIVWQTAGGTPVAVPYTVATAGATLTLTPVTQPLANYTQYSVQITAGVTDVAGNALAAGSVQTIGFRTADDVAPSAPGTPTDEGIYTTSLTLHFAWTGSTDPTPGSGLLEYRLRVATATDGSGVVYDPATDVGGTTTSRDVAVLVNGLTYYAQVEAIDVAGNEQWSGWSNGITVDTTPPGVPGTPEDPRGAFDDASVTFEWSPPTATPPSGIAQYESQVYEGTAVNPLYLLQTSTGSPAAVTFDATGRSGQVLTARARAQNGAGTWGNWSSLSAGVTVDTVAPSVTGRTPSPGQINIGTNVDVVFDFSEAMDEASVEAAFSVGCGTGCPKNGLAFVWSTDKRRVTVIPDTFDPVGATNVDLLPQSTVINVALGAGATDLAGNAVLATGNAPYSFTTADETAPSLASLKIGASLSPFPAASVKGPFTIVATFDEDMSASRGLMRLETTGDSIEARYSQSPSNVQGAVSVGGGQVRYTLNGCPPPPGISVGDYIGVLYAWPESFNVAGSLVRAIGTSGPNCTFTLDNATTATYGGGGSVFLPNPGSTRVAWTGPRTLEFTLPSDVSLPPAFEFAVAIQDVSDASGNYFWSSSIGQVAPLPGADTVAPFIVSAVPKSGSTGVARTTPVIIRFSEPMNEASLAASYAIDGGGGSYQMQYSSDQFGPILLFVPLAAPAGGSTVTVHVPATAHDLAGNTLTGAFDLSFSVAPQTDTGAPVLYESQPPSLRPVDQIYQVNATFADAVTGQLELLDARTVGSDDLLVTDVATGLLVRGHVASVSAGSGTLQIQPPARSPGFNTQGGPARTLLVALAGIHDFDGNVGTPASFTATLVPPGTNRVPTVESLRDLRIAITTSPLGRQLSAQLRVKDADNDTVTVTITAKGGTVTFPSATQALTNAFPTYYSYRFGGDGPPVGAVPPELDDTNFPTSGYYPFEIKLFDGTVTTTYVRQVWVWAPGDVPVGESIDDGGTVRPVDATRPIVLENTATPTFAWSGVDVANSDFVALQYLELSAANVGGSGGPAGLPLDKSLTSLTFPTALDPTIYAWFVTEMKFSAGEMSPDTQGWSLDFSKMLAASFVVGPANRGLGGRAFGTARASFAVNADPKVFDSAWDATGLYALESRLAGESAPVVVTETLTLNDATSSPPATEYFAAASDGRFMVTTTGTMGLPLANRGFIGRGGTFFAVVSQEQSKDRIAVGIEAGALYDPLAPITSANGTTFAFVQTEVRTLAGAYDSFSASVGEATAGATTLSVTGTRHDGTSISDPSPPPIIIPYSLTSGGRFSMDFSGMGGGAISGYVGGAPGAELAVLANEGNPDLSFLLIMARIYPWDGSETETLLDGQYHFVEYTVGADGLGVATEVHASYGVATFGGAAGTMTYAVSSAGGSRIGTGDFTLTTTDLGGGVYRGSVALVTDPGAPDEGHFLLTVGPDADTVFGVSQNDPAITGRPDYAQILIFSK